MIFVLDKLDLRFLKESKQTVTNTVLYASVKPSREIGKRLNFCSHLFRGSM